MLYKIILLSLVLSTSKEVKASELEQQAFPQSGFGQCFSGRAAIDWDAVKRLETTRGVNYVSTIIMQKIQPCMNASNPNFMKKLQSTCAENKGAQNQEWLCKAAGTPVPGASGEKNNTTLEFSSAQAAQAIQQALPEGSFFDRCSREAGQVNWAMVKQLVNNGYEKQILERIDKNLAPCINSKNKNFLATLENTCTTFIDSPSQSAICGNVASVVGRSNPVSQKAESSIVAGSVVQPVTGSVVAGGAASCPNLNAEKAQLEAAGQEIRKKEEELMEKEKQLTTTKESLEEYKKQLQDYAGQLTTYKEQLATYAQSLQR